MTERERLLHLTAAQTLRLHAARHGRRLMITQPDLDLEGFDFVLSSDYEPVHIQSKGTLKRGGRRKWKIRAALLKPSFHDRDLVPQMDGWKVGGFDVGSTGGVLVHVIDEVAAAAGRFEVAYRYLDVFWLIGVVSGRAGRSQAHRERALGLLRQIRAAGDDGLIELRFDDFARLASVAALADLRLHVAGFSNWASSCHTGEDLVHAVSGQPSVDTWAGVRSLLSR